ncbi:hypothetical protein LSTR_LSTR004923 [Laodelphax striatellus]|uniref:Uncharacterized protein n=1 Tax=Laodelphax striatellus TaxID=195883 RepID=A0A482XNP5_LAOST|nr:hypothetical protein LSTR_LSTR004923 [Laodelphax striatellus]
MDLRELKKAKKREKLLMKQLQQERVNEKCSEWEELNMNQELHPISHYINDREEMIKQMFNVVSERQLMKMLPPELKGMSVEELQADCLIQLVGMSKKRIMAILEGRELESSSESPSESDLDGTSMEEEPETIVKASKNKKSKKACKRTASTALQDTQKHAVLNSKKVKTKHRVKKEKIEVIESEESDNDVVDINTAATIKEAGVLPEKENVEHKGKTLLEILELEMRAKAIRALLERENQPEEEKQLKNEANKNPESAKTENTMGTTVEQVVNNVKEGIADKNNATDLIPSANEKDSEDIVILDEEIIKIDLTSDDDTPSKADDTSTKTADIVTEKEPNLNSQSTAVLQSDKPGSSTEISCERISSTVEKSSTSPEKSNWAQRWLDSSKVKKVVSTSKMCTNIRRKIKKSLMLKTKQVEESQPVVEAEPQLPIQEFSGSTHEYELLKKLVKKKKNDELSNQEKNESNTQEGIESQLRENSESNEQEGANLELQENSESHLQQHSVSNLEETLDSQPQDNRLTESSLQEDSNSQPLDESEAPLQEYSDSQPQDKNEAPLQEDLDSQPQEESVSSLQENLDSHPQDKNEPDLREDSELQLQEDNDSNLRVVTSESKEIGELNQEDVRRESQEENESPIQENKEGEEEEDEDRSQTQENSEIEKTENIQSNSQECSRSSSVYENSESNTQEISDAIAKEDSESIPDEIRELNSHKGKESSLHKNSEFNSSEDIEADRDENSETLLKSSTNSPENNELNAQDHIEQDSGAIENNSVDSNNSNEDTESETEDCGDDTE